MFFNLKQAKKYLAIFVIAVVLLSNGPIFFREVLAQGFETVEVVDDRSVTNNGAWIENKATALSTAKTAISAHLIEFKEYVLDGLAWTMANVIIDQFGDAIVDWIRNGFEGSPMFLSDPEGFFRDTANQVSGAIINDLDMEWLCDPLGPLRLSLDFFFPGTDRAKYACTFNDIADTFESYADRDDISDWINVKVNVHERNIVRAFGSDYRNGGFLMWLFTAQKKNNDLGRTIQTANDAYAAARISVGTEKFQLNMYQGFFGVKKCVEYREAYDLEGNKTNGDCAKYETKTPGTLVQDQLNNSANKDLARLQVADEIDEIIGALATTMIGWLLTGGNDEEGVLGYDKDADYSGANRDHFGDLSKSQELTQEKTKTAEQTEKIKSNEEPYGDSLDDYTGALDDTKAELEITLAKLECVRATSTNDTNNAYPDSDCDGADEDTQNILLSAVDKTESDITSDIIKIENLIIDIDSEIDEFNGQYGADAASDSDRAIELFDEFENEVMEATRLGEIKTIEEEYCYSYDKKNETGEICGVFGEESASDNILSVNISAESNPVISSKTKIYWKAVNAEYCDTTGGDSDKTWKKTNISTSGSYTTTSFEDGESRVYGIKCYDTENTEDEAEVEVSADSSIVAEMSGSLFAKNTLVKSGDSSSLYWLSTNASQCYLYSDNDSFDDETEYIADSSDEWFIGGEGYYLEISSNKTSGQSTAIFDFGETYKYKLICGDSGGAYSALSEIDIASEEEGDKETYQTHSGKEFKNLNKETVKIETEMESMASESACILNDYTQSEDVSAAECSAFEESSSSSLPE